MFHKIAIFLPLCSTDNCSIKPSNTKYYGEGNKHLESALHTNQISHSEYCFSLSVQMAWYSTQCGSWNNQMQLTYYRIVIEVYCKLKAIQCIM